jgi:hypothetical protein
MENGNKVRRASRRKYHYIYKTMCLITNKYYIGMHSTDNLDDGYVGSGKHLWYSINKHGLENHQTEILEFLPTRKELKQREAELVNEELLNDTLCMNLAIGGQGGAGTMTKEQLAKGGKRAMETIKRLRQTDPEYAAKNSKAISEAYYKAIKEGRRIPKQWGNWKGRTHSSETKAKIAESSKGKQSGEKNSQFGTCWIHNVETKQCIKIKNTEIDSYLSEGWTKGRKMKFK